MSNWNPADEAGRPFPWPSYPLKPPGFQHGGAGNGAPGGLGMPVGPTARRLPASLQAAGNPTQGLPRVPQDYGLADALTDPRFNGGRR